MALKETTYQLQNLLEIVGKDLQKAAQKGNKAASQRVRTGTIKLAKLAKLYRKESVKCEKESKGKKRAKAKAPVKRAVARKPSKSARRARR